jgi:hypothetical protein
MNDEEAETIIQQRLQSLEWEKRIKEKNDYLRQTVDAMNMQSGGWNGAIGAGIGGGGGSGSAAQANQYGAGQAAQNSALNNQSLQNLARNSFTEPAVYPHGVLYMNGHQLEADWRGAEYKDYVRTVNTKVWILRFRSEWSSDEIVVHLDIDAYSGTEVNKLAETYLEAINQRRLG